MKKHLTNSLLCLMCFSKSIIAMDILPNEINITAANASKYGINVFIRPGKICGDTNEFYIEIPREHNSDKLKYVNMSVIKEEKIMIDLVARIVEIEEFIGANSFHGITACIDRSILNDIKITISFGRGEITTYIFNVYKLGERIMKFY